MRVEDIIAASGGIAQAGPTVGEALGKIAANAKPGRVLIAGSLYLAGEVLKADLG
jgi:dihydrofolate synthase/folylpolyglutamate synthase